MTAWVPLREHKPSIVGPRVRGVNNWFCRDLRGPERNFAIESESIRLVGAPCQRGEGDIIDSAGVPEASKLGFRAGDGRPCRPLPRKLEGLKAEAAERDPDWPNGRCIDIISSFSFRFSHGHPLPTTTRV